MLTVIDDVAGFLIDVRITSTTEFLRLLEERDGCTARGKFDRGGKSAEAASDDDDVVTGSGFRDAGFRMRCQRYSPKRRCFTQYFTAMRN